MSLAEESDELNAWIDDWRAEDAGAATDIESIVRRVKRRSLGLKLLTIGELLIVIATLVSLTAFAVRHPHPLDIAAMSTLCLLALGALAFSLWNRRGLWTPATETTAAYLALAHARLRRRREALRFSRWLLAAETAIFLPWIWHRLHLGGGQPSLLAYALAYGYLALVVGVIGGVIAWLERWTRRELAALPNEVVLT
jgi:hypothetical protein